jgi:hypothetical protein
MASCGRLAIGLTIFVHSNRRITNPPQVNNLPHMVRINLRQGRAVPIPLYLQGHTLRTAAQLGWDKLTNGDLLTAAEGAGFDLLLTTDKNMRYQQNLVYRKIAIVVPGRHSSSKTFMRFGRATNPCFLERLNCQLTRYGWETAGGIRPGNGLPRGSRSD